MDEALESLEADFYEARREEEEDLENECGNPHNNADGPESCLECQVIIKGL